MIVSMEEMQQKLAEVEQATKAKNMKRCKKKRFRATLDDEIDNEDRRITQKMKKWKLVTVSRCNGSRVYQAILDFLRCPLVQNYSGVGVLGTYSK